MMATIQRGATGSWSGEITAGDDAILYEVRPGDSLSIIARDVLGDVSRWREIAALNNIPEPYIIHVGELLELPRSRRSTVVQLPTRSPVDHSPVTTTAQPGAEPEPGAVNWRKTLGWGSIIAGLAFLASRSL